MRTPFDTALRIQQREVDALRVAIGAEADRLGALHRASEEQAATETRERRAAQGLGLPTDAWTARMKAERERLDSETRAAETALAELRAQAADVYGKLRALQGAANRYREAAEQAAAAAEQAQIDDIAAARFSRARRAAKGRH